MTEKKKNTICVVQITRLGDLIQTYLACKNLVNNVDNLELELVAREKFAKPLEFILSTVFTKIHYFNFKKETQSEKDPKKLVQYLEGFVKDISKSDIDVLLNLSFSKSSNYLCNLIQAKNKLGTYYNANNEVVVYDPWSQYLYSNVMGGSFNTFSMVDIYKKIIGNTFHEKPVKKASPEKTRIVVHPFASLSKKRWKPAKWKEIIYKVLKSNPNISVHLVGSKNEIPQAEEIMNDPIIKPFHGQLVNHTGKTDIKQLHDLLNVSSHFVGHDSMVSHLASIVGTPSLTFTLGTVRPEETAPYSEGSLVVSPQTPCFPCYPDDPCDYFQCHADISYQAAYELIRTFMNNETISNEMLEKNISSFHLSSLNVQQVTFTPQGTLLLKTISNHDANAKTAMKLFYRIAWKYKLSESEEAHDFPRINKATYNELFSVVKGIRHLRDLFIFGYKYSQEILDELSKKEPVIAVLQEKSEKIDEIDKLIRMLGTAYPLLMPIINYAEVVKANILGENLVELSYGSCMAYKNSETILTIVFELLENTLRESKFDQGLPKEG